MQKILDKILGLPPAEERPDIPYAWVSKYCVNPLDKKKDFDYLLGQLCVCVFNVYVLVSALFIFVYLTDLNITFFLYEISVPERSKVKSLLFQYSVTMTRILLLIGYPFFLAKFIWTVNPKTYDILQRHPRYKDGAPRLRRKLIPQMLLCLFVPLFAMSYFMGPLVAFLGIRGNEGDWLSLFLYLFCLAVSSVFYVYSMLAITLATLVLVRYVGPHDGI